MNRADLSDGFQRLIIWSWLHTDALDRIRDAFRAEQFTDEARQVVAEEVLRFYDKRGKAPDLPTLTTIALVKARQVGIAARTIKAEIRECDEAGPPASLDDLMERAVEFARYRAVQRAVADAFDMAQRAEYDEMMDTLTQAVQVGEGLQSSGDDYFGSFEDRLVERAMSNGALPTGLRSLDEEIGGVDKGEEAVMVGAPGAGKTALLVNFGVSAMARGELVMHVTLEVSARKVELRYDARISGIPMNKLKHRKGKTGYALQRFRRASGGDLTVCEHPTESLTPRQLEAQVIRVQRTKGREVGLLIVDYGALMRSGRRYEDRRHELALIHRELRGMAMRFGCPVWTAHQLNRKGFFAEMPDLRNLSECFEIAQICDIMPVICQTKDEQESGRLRLNIQKNRNGRVGEVLSVRMDYARALALPG